MGTSFTVQTSLPSTKGGIQTELKIFKTILLRPPWYYQLIYIGVIVVKEVMPLRLADDICAFNCSIHSIIIDQLTDNLWSWYGLIILHSTKENVSSLSMIQNFYRFTLWFYLALKYKYLKFIAQTWKFLPLHSTAIIYLLTLWLNHKKIIDPKVR